MITSSVKINVPIGKTNDAIQAIQSILGWTCAQPGCLSMALYEDTNQPGVMMIFEEWENWPSLETHIRSDSYRNILELMELSSEQPEIKFCSVAETKGMEVIEKLRGR